MLSRVSIWSLKITSFVLYMERRIFYCTDITDAPQSPIQYQASFANASRCCNRNSFSSRFPILPACLFIRWPPHQATAKTKERDLVSCLKRTNQKPAMGAQTANQKAAVQVQIQANQEEVHKNHVMVLNANQECTLLKLKVAQMMIVSIWKKNLVLKRESWMRRKMKRI